MLPGNKIYWLKSFFVLGFVAFFAVLCWRNLVSPTISVSAQQNTTVESNSATNTAVNTSNVNSEPKTTNESETSKTEETEPIEGCIKCHGNTEPMHRYNSKGDVFEKLEKGRDALGLSCTACHGGNPAAETQAAAHVKPKFPEEWNCKNGNCSSANPERTNTLLAKESQEFVRFINPGDFRVAATSCNECHTEDVHKNRRSMMTHGSMLWGAALYNNGGFPLKDNRFGESYNENGNPQSLIQIPAPTREQQVFKGILSFLEPLPRWEISQPGNVLRVFERGGKRRLEVGLPDKEEEPGKPDKGLSPRGFGTNNRTDPVYLGIQKTRLLDPTLNFLGTNDHPGDYRSSGCTSCHVIYANDRDPSHSEQYAAAGNSGESQTGDASIPKNQPGHPIKHQFTSRIPTSQCMVCHMHPGTNMVASYLGTTWWDNETDGKFMYPEKQENPTENEEAEKLDRNPEGSSLRGKWSDPEFLKKTGTHEFNKQLKNTKFADFHGHGWMFRSVFNKNRKGEWLDSHGQTIAPDDPDKFKKAVHLKDIHLERGMHCTDCHFQQDNHGDGKLYTEPRAAIEIGCVDCHGSVQQRSNLFTSGFGAEDFDPNDENDKKEVERRNKANPKQPLKGSNLSQLRFRKPDGKRQNVFQRVTTGNLNTLKKLACKDDTGEEVKFVAGDILQFSTVVPDRCWRVKQTVDTVIENANHKEDYSEKSAYAKTIQKDNATWGNVASEEKLAHSDSNMTCYSCHSSWMTSCFGCHLSMEANRKMPNRHNEGGDSRNFTSYNYQVLRDEVFMLGKDGTVTGHRVAPVRSSSAVLVSSRNQNREWIYQQQQTVSAEGFAGQAFNTHVPHTVRGRETKGCSDCHVSKDNNNNAWMAQLLLQGTNFVNFIGQYAFVAAEDSLEAVAVTEPDEPQAVFGSTLHKIAYPDNFKKFEKDGRELKKVYEHAGNPKVLQVQVRGEYAYVASGKGGLRVYDIAQIDHKGFSERITSAPVSPLGQRFYVDTKYATAVAAPSTLAVDPARWRMMRDETGKIVSIDPDTANKLHSEAIKAGKPSPMINEEQPIHPLYAYLYIADKEEGLILVNAATLLDGDPQNNFLKRALTFNPENALTGANNITIAGTNAFITTDRELVIVDINDPLNPRVKQRIGAPQLKNPRAVSIQFRYGFIVDSDGLKVLDLSGLMQKDGMARVVEKDNVPVSVALKHAHDVYVARTYAYVANGEEGVAIIDVENPESPQLAQMFNADGKLNDTHGVKVAMTNASLYAYVADGKNGLRVLQLTDPETMPTFAGFSPKPEPRLIATYKTKGAALAVSKGLDRDRAADESGNQVAVFGRRGARPFNLEEVNRLLRTNDGTGDFFRVSDEPIAPNKQQAETIAPAAENSGWSRFWKSLLTYGGFGFSFILICFSLSAKRNKSDKAN